MRAKAGPMLYLIVAAALAVNAAIWGLLALREGRLGPRVMAVGIYTSGAVLWVIGYFRLRRKAGGQ